MPTKPDKFILDPDHTFAHFEYDHFGFSYQSSRFDKVSGDIQIDFKNQTGNVSMRIDTRSVNTGSELFNSHLQGKDFFDTNQYPEATFISEEIEFENEKIVAINGVLTIKGNHVNTTLELVHFERGQHPITGKEYCGANAVAVVSRSDFAMGKYTPQIGDDIVIKISIEATKQ